MQYLNSSCTGPLCVQVEDYGQVRDSVQAYTSGDVKVWIGTSYTSYGLYEVIPKVGLPGPGSCQAPSPLSPPRAPISLNLTGKRGQPLDHSGSWSVSSGAVSPLLGLPGKRQEKQQQDIVHREPRHCHRGWGSRGSEVTKRETENNCARTLDE